MIANVLDRMTPPLSAGASAAVLIAPVAQHRMLFRMGRMPYLVRSAHRVAPAGRALLLLSMASSVLLVTDAVLPRPMAIAVAAVVASWFVVLWMVARWWELRTDGNA